MSAVGDGPGELQSACAAALGISRKVQEHLRETVIPILPPARRTFAEWLARNLDQGAVFDEPMLRDIDAFIALIDREVVMGTHIGFRADDYHVRGGYDVVDLDERASALSPALADLRRLRVSIAVVLDAARAVSVATDLTRT